MHLILAWNVTGQDSSREAPPKYLGTQSNLVPTSISVEPQRLSFGRHYLIPPPLMPIT